MHPLAEAYEQIIAALTVWREARGESQAAKLGVYWVILNRRRDPRWPNTISQVCLQPKQFSSFNILDPNASKFPSPDEYSWAESCEVVYSPGLTDPTDGANHYHSGLATKKWALDNKGKITAKIGAFTFYKL